MFIQSEKLSAIAATTTKSKSHKKLKQKKASNRNKNKWTKDTEKKVLKNATEDSQIKKKETTKQIGSKSMKNNNKINKIKYNKKKGNKKFESNKNKQDKQFEQQNTVWRKKFLKAVSSKQHYSHDNTWVKYSSSIFFFLYSLFYCSNPSIYVAVGCSYYKVVCF